MRDMRITAPEAFQRAAALHGQGRLREAEALYENILRNDNRHFDAIFCLGFIRLQQNRFADAEALFRRAIKINKKSADAEHHLANALTALGRLDDAVGHYRNALDLKPRDIGIHNNLGYVLERLGRYQEARTRYQTALTINPSYPEAHNNLGNVLQSLGQTEEAIEHYRQAVALQPDNAAAHNNLASALAARDRHEEAIEHCEKALTLAPGNALIHLNIANSLNAIEQPEEALMHYRKAIAIDPLNAESYVRLGLTLYRLGRVQDAIAQYEKALTIKPDHVDALRNLGDALSALGKLDEAIALFEKAIAAAPRTAASLYYNLAVCKRISASDPHLAAMQQWTREMESLKVKDQINLHFALGKAYADIGDHQQSFQHLLSGNALRRREFANYDETKVLRDFENIQTTFTTELLNSKKLAGDPSSTPVFIIGMPRSGTSLVEQILASHPKVFGGGERYELFNLVGTIAGPDGAKFPEAVARLSGEELRALGASYVRAVEALAPNVERITDKMPGNFMHAGLIHLALPNARIIHIHRDPRDTAISCFSTLFTAYHPFAYDLAELGRCIRGYEKLMEHWRRVLPEGAMIEVQYEQLVEKLENEAKRIIEYCGLEWDDACLSFHKTKRPVFTASVAQVRQPIYSSSVGRWQLYEKELEPFQRAYSAT